MNRMHLDKIAIKKVNQQNLVLINIVRLGGS